jgi:hypothetical protein
LKPEFARWQQAVIGAYVLSLAAAAACRGLGATTLLLPVATPALVLSAWATFGHLITLDDDLKGGWSNPEGDRGVIGSSLAELAIKVLALAAVAVVVWVR